MRRTNCSKALQDPDPQIQRAALLGLCRILGVNLLDVELIDGHTPRTEPPQPQFKEEGLQDPAEQLRFEIVAKLKSLAAGFPDDPEAKVRRRDRTVPRPEPELLGRVAERIAAPDRAAPARCRPDYKGKQARAVLVNRLLDALHLAILVEDRMGNQHECSVSAVRGRDSDHKGYLRLHDRRKRHPAKNTPDSISSGIARH